MPSKREQIITSLYNTLKPLENVGIKVCRNLDKPQKITSLVILRDGTSENPEILLSPTAYIYEHNVTLEILVQHPDAQRRDASLDNLLVTIGGLINANRTLGGLAEWMEPSPPEFTEEVIEGAATIRMAVVPVMVRFMTSDPLGI